MPSAENAALIATLFKELTIEKVAMSMIYATPDTPAAENSYAPVRGENGMLNVPGITVLLRTHDGAARFDFAIYLNKEQKATVFPLFDMRRNVVKWPDMEECFRIHALMVATLEAFEEREEFEPLLAGASIILALFYDHLNHKIDRETLRNITKPGLGLIGRILQDFFGAMSTIGAEHAGQITAETKDLLAKFQKAPT